MRSSERRAFTLVELMIVVAMVAVLAVLAVYGVRKYLANARTGEARNALGRIAQDAVTRYEEETMSTKVLKEKKSAAVTRGYCADSTVNVPATAPRGAKYQSTVQDWNNKKDAKKNVGFPCLRFEMTQPQYYSYSYGGVVAGAAGAFTALARGDLNGDGTLSSFYLTGGVISSRPTIAPAIGEISPTE